MQPTLHSGDIALTRPRFHHVSRGQIVLLSRQGSSLVKRVVGRPGDEVELEAGRLRVNGVGVDGREPIPGAEVMRWTVPPGHYFVVGDNAEASTDSRTWTDPFVSHGQVAGVVIHRWRRSPGQRNQGSSRDRHQPQPVRTVRGVPSPG